MTDQIKERPILFSAPMVRALMDGSKTQTRRILKGSTEFKGPYSPAYLEQHKESEGWKRICPHGKPGDRLWVREAWQSLCDHDHLKPSEIPPGSDVQYPATYDGWVSKRRPAMFMPRWASRILLEIVDVRVERLQDISEEDARGEGLKALTKDGQTIKYGIPDRDGFPGTDDDGWPWREWEQDPRKSYRKLWESINGPGSWDANPWVWVIEFKKVEEK